MKPQAKPFIVEIKPSRRMIKIRMKQRSQLISAGPVEAADKGSAEDRAQTTFRSTRLQLR